LNLNRLKNIYNKSPFFLKKLYSLIPFSLRSGGEYKKWLILLKKNINVIDRNPMDSFEKARDEFEFYQKFYGDKKIGRWEDIPFTVKSDLQYSLTEFENRRTKKFYVTTGGVTGTPVKFYQSSNVWYKELAFVHDFFGQFGYNTSFLKLSLRGGDFSNLKKNTFWQFNPIQNEIHFSPFHLTEHTVKQYVDQINKTRPKYFHSYPSGLIRLVKLMSSQNLALSYQPICIFLISESFTHNELQFIKSFFNCAVTSFYGLSERIIFAPYNIEKNYYVPDSRYGYFELIDENGLIISEDNIRGEIVGTSYDNHAMPLVRYRTGDFTQYVDFKIKAFKAIEGKWGQDFLIGKYSEEVTITALNLHSNELNDLIRIQFVQVENGLVYINAHFKQSKSREDLRSIEKLLINRVGNCIEFKFSKKNDFYTNQRGKTPLIITQNLTK
jgi:phenylacetate-CoA ligase